MRFATIALLLLVACSSPTPSAAPPTTDPGFLMQTAFDRHCIPGMDSAKYSSAKDAAAAQAIAAQNLANLHATHVVFVTTPPLADGTTFVAVYYERCT